MPKQTYYITTAIDYPNAKPHIGHAYEKIIADLYARWHELLGNDVFFLTGVDEHGQKIEKTAAAAGKRPKEFCDEMALHFQEMCKKLNIRNNDFIRTTEKRHTKTALDIFQKALDKGLIYKGNYTGLYCTGCEAYYTEKDLDNGNCTIHKRPCEKLSEENYFFKIGTFQDKIIKHIEQYLGFIQPESRRNEILFRLKKEPISDLSVSRTSINWGIPLPFDKKHVLYVWFDALTNYLSGISYPTKKFQKYWPAQLQLIGKDIIWFHTVIWPAILMAAELPLPKTVFAHGFLTVNGEKMSKSLGNIIDPIAVVNTYGADPLRFVLLRDVSAGEDGDFSEKALIDRNNTELADALGNLLQRTSVMIHKYFNGNIPVCGELTDKEKELQESIPEVLKLTELLNNYRWNQFVEHIWHYIHKCNKYINDTEPWKQSNDAERLATILYNLVEHLRIISILVYPIIPESSEQIAAQIGQKRGTIKNIKFTKKTTGMISEPKILFKKIETDKPTEPAHPPSDPFGALNLKVARVEKVEPHPNADKLYVVTLNAGNEQRTLVAGLKQYYSPEQLTGKHIVFISNLKPAQLRGVTSQGMMLAGEKNGTVKVLDASIAQPGEQVFVEGITPHTAQITIDDFMKIKLTTKNKHVVYGDKPLKTKSGIITVDLEDSATIR